MKASFASVECSGPDDVVGGVTFAACLVGSTASPGRLSIAFAIMSSRKIAVPDDVSDRVEKDRSGEGRIRNCIDAIVLTPAAGALEAHVVRRGQRVQAEAGGQGSLQIELRGNLAAMLTMAARLRARGSGGATAGFPA
jgi:hypothetical protein